MSLLLAAIGGTAAALLEVSLVPYLRIGDAYPHPVLVLGVIWTIAAGIEGGLVWAFVGGLALDVLAQRPLGTSAFALLLAIGVAAAIGRVFIRVRPIAPILATPVCSFVNSITLLLVIGAMRSPIPVGSPAAVLAPGIVYDAVLALIIGPLAVALRDRYADQERVDW